MFYVYNQNNSGGNFTVNERLGKAVVIQADSLTQANDKAVSIGIYFDGMYNDFDCSCCGDRWSRNPSGWSKLRDALKYLELLINTSDERFYCPIYSYNEAMELIVLQYDDVIKMV